MTNNTGPVKKGRQQNVLPADKDNIAPSNHAAESTGMTGPKTRRNGRQQEAAVVPTSNSGNNNKEPRTTNPGVRKRNHKGRDAQEENDDPPAKRTKAGDARETPAEASKGRTRKQAKEYMPRDPLPDRQGRNIHPAGLPTTRRTSQEVAAHRESQKKALEEKIREGERAKQLFAQMSIAEEQLDEEMPLRNPQRLSAAICKHGQDRLEDSDMGEDFDFEEVDDGSSSESDVSVVQPAQRSKVSGDISHQTWTN